jgi:perosamine synthetase
MEKLAMFGGEPVRKKPIPRWPVFREEYAEKLIDVLRNGGFSELTGDVAEEFADRFSSMIDTRYGLTVSNGTSAIHLALIGVGVNPGDEVLVPAHTFIGSATPILMQNAIPVFVDVDENTYTMDPDDLERKITERSKAVIVVHLNGNPAKMDEIIEVARKHNLKIIEDCAQAHGATFNGKYVGSLGDVGTFSFWEDKIITTAGEGGMVVTNDPDMFEKMKAAKSHGEEEVRKGEERKYYHTFLGYNYRMTEFQAMYGILELEHLQEYVDKRRKNAEYLTRELQKFKGVYTCLLYTSPSPRD